MRQVMFRRHAGAWVVLPVGVLVGSLMAISQGPSAADEPLAEPPAGQSYIGLKACALCHVAQFTAWGKTPHAKAFEKLPVEHLADGSCLKCHSTGYGQSSGYKTQQQTPDLAGVTCEACHGPGSKHAEAARSLGNQKLSEEDKAYIRSTISSTLPKTVCVQCHLAEAHKQPPEE